MFYLVLLNTVFSFSANAMTFTINNQSSLLGTGGADGVVRTAVFQLASQLQNQVNNNVLIPESSFQSALTAFSNGVAAGGNGLGVMYEGGLQKFAIGGGIGAGYSGNVYSLASLGSIRTNQLPDIGGGLQASVVIGANAGGMGWKLGRLDPKRLNYFANVMYLYHPSLYNTALRLWNVGAHIQYHIHAPGKDNLIFHWSGIALTTGLRYMNQDAAYLTSMMITQADTASQTTMSWSANYNLGVRSSVFTIPLEVTSNFDFFDTFGFLLGTGVDLCLGGSATYGGASGPIAATSTLGGLSTQNIFSGTGVLDAGSNSYAPSIGILKAIFGVHVNLWAMRVIAQATANTSSSYSLYGGLHLML